MTLDELKEHGYRFEISGARYVVRHTPVARRPVLAVNKIKESSPTGHITNAGIRIAQYRMSDVYRAMLDKEINLQMIAGKSWSSMTMDGLKWPRNASHRVVIKGHIMQAHRRHKSGPHRNISIESIKRMCIEAAMKDLVLQKLKA